MRLPSVALAALALPFVLPLALAGCAASPELPPGASLADWHYRQGLSSLEKGQVEDALGSLDDALAEEPGFLDAIRARVDVHRRLGRLPTLLAELEERAADAPKDPAAHYALGIARFASGAAALEPALAALKRAAELAPEVGEYQLRLGVALLEAERYGEALKPLQRAVELEPRRARAYLPLGLCRYRLGDRQGALATLSELLRHDPDPRDVQLAARTVGRMYDPFRDFPQILGKDLEEAILWVERADAPRQALDKIEVMLEKFPDQAVLHRLAGLCYERLDDSGRAIEEFRRAMELAPDDPTPHQHLGDLYHTKDKLQVADEQYVETVKRNPFNFQARRRLGQYALDRGNAKEAVEHLQVASWLEPESANERVILANALALAGELPAATAQLAWVVERDPKALEAWMQLGTVLLERKRREKDPGERKLLGEKAAIAFEKVLDKQPENAAAARYLASARD